MRKPHLLVRLEKNLRWVGVVMLSKKFTAFMRTEDGATSIEYALIASIVSIGIAASLTSARTELVAAFTTVVTSFKGATN